MAAIDNSLSIGPKTGLNIGLNISRIPDLNPALLTEASADLLAMRRDRRCCTGRLTGRSTDRSTGRSTGQRQHRSQQATPGASFEQPR